MPSEETWPCAAEKVGESESFWAGRQARLGGAGAVADHDLVSLLRHLDGLRETRIAHLEAGSAARELQRLDRPVAELEQALKLIQEPTRQSGVLRLDDERAGQGRLRRPLHVDHGIAERTGELFERGSSGLLDLLLDGSRSWGSGP